LVVIAIIAVLIALLLPAVQQAREAARRSQCKNSLKQIGLAIHNYHETFNTIPPGWIDGNGTAGGGTNSLFGWTSFLLPQIDQAPLYNKLNFNVAWSVDGTNPQTVLPVFRCPSDTGSITTTAGNSNLTSGVGRSNYPGVAGITLTSFTSATSFLNVGVGITATPVTVANYNGSFGINSKHNFRDFSDGLSNAIVVGERRSSGGPTANPNNPGLDTVWVGLTTVDNVLPAAAVPAQAAIIGDTLTAPNTATINGTYATPGVGTGFSSLHTGGAQFLLGDGSVRFISANVNFLTYCELSTIGDGLPLPSDF
jgi:type II secretory pathway pseudopilin PulG